MNDVLIVVSIATFVASLVAAIGALVNSERIKEVQEEVKTANSQTLAQLADAVETRRIKIIPIKDRTRQEKSHLEETT